VWELSRKLVNNCNNFFSFGDASFFVSPARRVEAQDMSGNLKQKKLQYELQETDFAVTE
jgi:hypothetical protein